MERRGLPDRWRHGTVHDVLPSHGDGAGFWSAYDQWSGEAGMKGDDGPALPDWVRKLVEYFMPSAELDRGARFTHEELNRARLQITDQLEEFNNVRR
ncbi:hypothetical protein ACSHXN_44955 (plasmid) [Streptomyces sp. HUAS TT11]|uniref:hypothetical protein n=1 Tax=Streptomyces sp. HUAS TT11 TaxID=3447508 RepID=UPI003F6603B7